MMPGDKCKVITEAFWTGELIHRRGILIKPYTDPFDLKTTLIWEILLFDKYDGYDYSGRNSKGILQYFITASEKDITVFDPYEEIKNIKL